MRKPPITQRPPSRTVFAGFTQTITLLKRKDDQKQGTVTALRVFRCRRSFNTKSGETIQGSMSVVGRTTWHLPHKELLRVGVDYINALDRIVDNEGLVWQPEATTTIVEKLLGEEIDVDCLLIKGKTTQG